MYTPLNSGAIDAAIAAELRRVISTGELPPGARLNESTLANEFNVSRGSIRAANRTLEAEGLVTILPRRGSFVRIFTGEEVRDLYRVRYALEAAAAELVAEAHDPTSLKILETKYENLRRSAGRGHAESVAADKEFHRSIVELSGSRGLLERWLRVDRQLTLASTQIDPTLFEVLFVDVTHGTLMASIVSRDYLTIRNSLLTLRRVGDELAARWDSIHSSSVREKIKVDKANHPELDSE